MSKFDVEYLKLCKKILKEGKEVITRSGTTIKIPFYTFEFDLQDEFPMLTTKHFFWKNSITELLWIYQAQSNDVRWLQERNNTIWDEWEINEDGIWKANQNIVNDKGEYENVEVTKQYPKELAHTIGTAYGYVVNKYKRLDYVLNSLKNNPNDRRMVLSLWQDEDIPTGVLEPCVWGSEWDVTDGKLNTIVLQRSCDTALGVPFNVSQYAMLNLLLAQVTGLEPGKILHTMKDVHIYKNHIPGIELQIERGKTLPDLPAPKIWINPEIGDFYKFDNSRELKDIKVLNYKHYESIPFEIAK